MPLVLSPTFLEVFILKRDKNISFIYNSIILFFIFFIIGIVIYGLSNGVFSSEANFCLFIEKTGFLAPITFILLEIISVVILIIPCSLGYGVGSVVFGAFWGTILNCIASFLGSIIIFLIVRRWGNKLLNIFVSEKKLKKYYHLIENDKRFEKFFAVMLLLPFTPDNILCFIAGTTKISFKRYALIVLLFKLWKIGFFCYGVDFCIDIFKIIG